MRRAFRIGAGLGLALFIATCTDQSVTEPKRPGIAALDLAAWAATAAGDPPVPVESLQITLQRPANLSIPAFDTTFAFRPPADSAVIRLNIDLNQNSETFQLTVRAFGGGFDWYLATGSITVTAGSSTTANPLVRYVGPGANAARVAMLPADTTAVGGNGFPLRAVVYDSGSNVIPGVPVGYRLSDSTRGTIVYPTYSTAMFTGAVPVRDSVWVVAETPTHLKDSTRLHLVPPPAQLVKISGDIQATTVGVPLPQPLVVRVLDALNGGFKGQTVTWTATTGGATLSAPTSVTDDTGYAQVTVTPTQVTPLTIQAAAGTLTGSPVSFGVTVGSGQIKQVIISPKVDTIANSTTAQYTAVATDSLGNTVSATFTWTSTVLTVATINSSGLATAVGGDSTLIIATAGGVADTARLYVRALRSIAVSPADTVITAVGDSLLLTTAAFDNFGAPVTSGLNIRFTSASPTIATVNRLTGRVLVTGPGNGVILARDSTTGVQGSVTLRVNQVTAGIVNNPMDSVVVGVSGQTQIVANAVDRNGYPIPSKIFGWVSRNPSIATVNGTGLVTGVALGTTFAVDSVDGFIDSTKVVVTALPPQLIQWAFDSTSVGNGGNVSIALSVTQPPVAPLTISIASTDTSIAKAIPNVVTIGTGASGTSVVIYGLRTGRAVFTATDASGQGYQAKAMIVGVVSTIEFREIASSCCRQQYFYLNQNETHKAQVWLSDPAPAGGLGITFVYGRPGTSVVTPSPAIIPAGQLSADVTFQGLAPGPGGQPDSVVPTSGGYVGKFSYVYVAPDSLRLSVPYPSMVGVGQYFQPYVWFTYAMDHPLLVSTRLSRLLGTTGDTVTIPTGSTYAYFTVTARSAGVDTLTVSAPGWVTAAAPVAFTTPRLQLYGTASLVAGAPNGYWYAYTADSLSYTHPVADTVTVTVVTRNPSAVAIDTATAKVVPGASVSQSRYGLRPLAAAGGDSAWIVATAPGYRPDSIKVYVTNPTLTLVLSYPQMTGVGTVFQNAGYVSIPYARPDTFTVVFGHTQPSIVSGPDSVSIPKGQTTAYFPMTGVALGVDTISVTRATGYALPAPTQFQVVPIHVRPNNPSPVTLYTISRPQGVYAIEYDSVFPNYSHPLVAPLRVALGTSNTQAFTLDSAFVTIPAGATASNYDTLRVLLTGAGQQGRVLSTAPGSSADSSGLITVDSTPLAVNLAYPYQAGRGLQLQNSSVSLPDLAPAPVQVTLKVYNPLIDSLDVSTVTIPAGSYSAGGFNVLALDSTGTDSITASATGFVRGIANFTAVPAALTVGNPGTSHLTSDPAQTVIMYTRMGPFPQYVQNPWLPVTVTIVSSDSSKIRIDSAGTVIRGDSATSVVTAGQYYGYFRIKYVGSGTAYLRIAATGFSPDSTPLITVQGPSLHLAYTSVTLGVGQVFGGQYVYVDNPVPSDVVVTLAGSDSTLPPAQQAFQLSTNSVTIPANSWTSPSFDITGNAVGSAYLIARTTGSYTEAAGVVSVQQPKLGISFSSSVSVGQRNTLTVYAEDDGGTPHPVASPLVVTVASNVPTHTTFDSTTITIPAGFSYVQTGVVFDTAGTYTITATAPGYASASQITNATGALVTMVSGNRFTPANVTISAGQYVTWKNEDTVIHTSTSDTGVTPAWNSGTLATGQTYTVYFSTPGIYPYHCSIHGAAVMSGTITVTP